MCNDIGADGAEQLSLALQVSNLFLISIFYIINYLFKKNETLVYLNLNGNKIGNLGGMHMAQMLQVNFSLQHLDIGDTDQVNEWF
jgi:hypothetical protein